MLKYNGLPYGNFIISLKTGNNKAVKFKKRDKTSIKFALKKEQVCYRSKVPTFYADGNGWF